jgi:hypothetical protein
VVTVAVSPCHGDDRFAAELAAHRSGRTWSLPATASLEEVAATVAGAGCFLGVSLHAAITALAYGRPWVTYDPFGQAKLAAFAELVGARQRRTGDPAEAVRLAAGHAAAPPPTVDATDLRRRIDAHFDRIAELVEQAAPAAQPVGWDDTAAPLHLALRRVPRPATPAPQARPAGLRRPDVAPAPDELAAAVARARAARGDRRTAEADEHDELDRLRAENDDLRGAVLHLEGLEGAVRRLEGEVARHQASEADLRERLDACAAARAAVEESLAQARASRIYRWTGRPRSLGAPEPTAN